MNTTLKNKVGLGFLGFLIVCLFGYVVVQYFIIGAKPDSGFVGTKVDIQGIAFRPWIYVLYFHIITASLALIVGPFQFSKKLRNRNKKLHRTLGKIYVYSIILSFVVGLYLAVFSTGGITGVIGFYSLEIAWILTTLVGLLKIKRKEMIAHQEWMIRSYAITLTFVTFRIFSIAPLFFEEKPGFLFGSTIILSWVFNLWIAERIIKKSRQQKTIRSNHIETSI